MGINRGKQFEDIIHEQFKKIPDISIDRLYDVTTGFKNHNNICDFIVFKKGTLNYFECKAIHGNTLNFKSHIRKNQWEGLLNKSPISMVNAGIIVWFIDLDKTYFIDIEYLDYLKEQGNKSFNAVSDIDKIPIIEIKGRKKKVFFEYELEDFLRSLRYE